MPLSRTTRLAFVLIAGSTAAGAQVPAALLDSVFRSLESKLAHFASRLDSMRAALRPDSATPRADSTFRVWRAATGALVPFFPAGLMDSALTVIVHPDGALAQQQRMSQLERPLSADSAAHLRADSIVAFLGRRGLWVARDEGSVYVELGQRTLWQRMGPYLTPPTREALEEHLQLLE